MKQFNIAVIFFLFFTGCMSREERYYRDKALELINKNLIQTLNNYDSYEPISTEISRLGLDYLGDSLVQNLIKDIRKADSIVDLKREEEKKSI